MCTPANDHHNRHDGELTFVGRVMAELPVDIRIGKLIILGYVFGLLEECLIIGTENHNYNILIINIDMHL